MKSVLFIRADGSTEIGLGHLVRCISLACILKSRFRIVFVCREIPDSIKEELDTHGFELLEIKDEQVFFDRLSAGMIIVLDGYHFDSDYQKRIKKSGCMLVCIDDIHDREFHADLVINHAPGVRRGDYQALPNTQFALGTDYALLRSSFLKQAKINRIPEDEDTETILICFGGSDIKNLTNRTAKVVRDFNRFKKIIVITGSAYKFEFQIDASENTQFEYYHSVDEKQMLRLMLESGIAVVPASGILFEALAAGSKVISGCYNENQKDVYSGFKKLGAIIDAGSFRENEIYSALQHIGQPGKTNIIDGKSPGRFLKLFQNLSQKT